LRIIGEFAQFPYLSAAHEAHVRTAFEKRRDSEKMTLEPETEMPLPPFDFDELEHRIEHSLTDYQSAAPFPHIVIDNFLRQDVLEAVTAEFPELDTETWNNYLHVNERKFSHTDPSTWGPTLQHLLDELNSPRFVRLIGDLLGKNDLRADPSLEGGGLHQSTTGGFLNIHADFTVHPHNRKWQRRANLILYLNEGWKEDWGGDLEMWSADMKECVKKVSPIGNRVVIFTTDPTSFHGHPEPMTCPEGTMRRSLALYYFSVEEDPMVRSTEYRSRPGDGAHSILIFADTLMLRGYDWTKRHLGLSDQTASKLLSYRERFRRKGTQG
jgi:Rps23 Pro-64 3,4-dihydroxylase Tpa1-like proline 4-hydroxylase